MTKIGVNPRLMRDYVVALTDDTYEAATASVLFTPTVQTQNWTGGDDATYSESSPPIWTVAIGKMQDWENANSLARQLHTLGRTGAQIALVFKPRRLSGPRFSTTISAVPGAIGGTNGAWPQDTVTMGCTWPELIEAEVATGATAGSPGEYTPLFATVPADLAALAGVTADPVTAWTTGQFVRLADGSEAHWDGAAWVAGQAS